MPGTTYTDTRPNISRYTHPTPDSTYTPRAPPRRTRSISPPLDRNPAFVPMAPSSPDRPRRAAIHSVQPQGALERFEVINAGYNLDGRRRTPETRERVETLNTLLELKDTLEDLLTKTRQVHRIFQTLYNDYRIGTLH